MSTAGRAGDALSAAGRIRASTDRVRDSVGAALGGEAVLAMPGHQPRTREQRERAERLTALENRAASRVVVRLARRRGCMDGTCGHEPEDAGCALIVLRAVGLAADPVSGASTTDLGIRKQASKKGKGAGPA